MKSLIFTFLILLSFGLQAQDVEPIQRSLITKRTATWCPPCGGWGWDFFHNAIDQNEDKAFFFAAHHSGDLVNPTANNITSNWGAVSQPRFYFNETDISASSSSSAAKLVELKDLVDAAYEMQPTVGVGLEVFWDAANEQILINTNTKFFENATGGFYTAVYLVEDNVINFQQNQGPNANHERVLRASFSDGDFGVPFIISEFAANDEFPNEFTMTGIENPMVSNLNYEYVAIVWQKVGEKYEVVNVNGTTEINELVVNGVEEITTTGVAVYPSVFSDLVTVEFDLTTSVERAEFTVIDLTGKVVYTAVNSSLSSGQQNIFLDLSAIATTGTYFLSIDLEGQKLTRKLIRK
ncbi:MAG: hypothetical protein ACI9XO_003821 [Paraglaciecola sp.]|jgi:hypothetical protein